MRKLKNTWFLRGNPHGEKPRANMCATHGQRNPLYEKESTPSSDSQTLTLDNLRLWTLPLATLGSIPSDIPWYTTLGVSTLSSTTRAFYSGSSPICLVTTYSRCRDLIPVYHSRLPISNLSTEKHNPMWIYHDIQICKIELGYSRCSPRMMKWQ